MKYGIRWTWPFGFCLFLTQLVPLGAVEKPDVKAAIGQVVYDFVLTDATGKDAKWSELLRSGPKGENRPAVLFFY